ncbi:chondroadherin-like [Anabrus simplex]|uniref:chondroadherin-like n=1 Tax=Anabrus simplex TaxID=316456 RepID=UPI0035A286E0
MDDERPSWREKWLPFLPLEGTDTRRGSRMTTWRIEATDTGREPCMTTWRPVKERSAKSSCNPTVTTNSYKMENTKHQAQKLAQWTDAFLGFMESWKHLLNVSRHENIISKTRRKKNLVRCNSSTVLISLLFILLLDVSSAMCPPKCTCDDETLKASCGEAGLEVVPIQLNPDVKTINLEGNRISNVHLTLPFYTNLRWLDVSRNRISTLGVRNFEYQQKLVHLNVSLNEITNLSKDTFRGLKNLRVLDISQNMLENIEGVALSDLPDLAELYMSGNKIISIGDRVFDHLSNLRVLKLEDNQLLDIPTPALRRLPSLKILGLSGNLIESIEEDSLPALRDLRSLTLQGNLISKIHRAAFDGLQSLQLLDLSENNLTSVPTAQLSKLTNLAELDLSANNFVILEPVAFQSLFELRRLRVCRLPKLRRVDVRAFVDNIKLESVVMDDNSALQALPTRLFHGNPLLVDISVRGNGFTSLDSAHFPLDQLHSLSLSDNPLHCNCSLLWLWLLTRKQLDTDAKNLTLAAATNSPDTIPRLDIDGIRCAEPETLRNLLVVDVPESEVRCDASWLAVIIVTIVVMALFALTCGMLLLLGTGRWCKKRDELPEPPHHSHLQNGAVLMLMTTKDNMDSMDNFMLKAKEPLVSEMQFQHWDSIAKENGTAESHVYHMNGNAKKPAHIVYV